MEESKRPHGFSNMTHERLSEVGRQGGLKSAETKRRKKHMKELANIILNMQITDADEIRSMLKEGGLNNEDLNIAAGIIFVQAQKAMLGDTKAAEFVRDTSGQKPGETVQVGNLDDQPFETLDLSQLSDEELQVIMARKMEILNAHEEEE